MTAHCHVLSFSLCLLEQKLLKAHLLKYICILWSKITRYLGGIISHHEYLVMCFGDLGQYSQQYFLRNLQMRPKT